MPYWRYTPGGDETLKKNSHLSPQWHALLDSSNIEIEGRDRPQNSSSVPSDCSLHSTDWIRIATEIELNYSLFDAFVILHGTDTMAYTSSALSFLLEDLGKTVVRFHAGHLATYS